MGVATREGREIYAAVRRTPLDVPALLTHAGGDRDGAVVLFLGTVRNHHEGRAVEAIEYEAFEPMAREVLQELALQAAERFGLSRVAVEHRLGRLAVGEASVAVALSSPHRAEAFDGAQWLLAELKRSAPIWKKEFFREGDSRWVEGVDPRPAAGAAEGGR